MDETELELEEGEACSYNHNGVDDDDDDKFIDPDIALSYIDEKLQDYLGHFKRDFEGVVSAESLGAKFGIYGSFLPAHRRSPHSRTPPRIQNHSTPQSLNTLQVEGGYHNSLPPANVSSSIKQGSASVGSASSNAYKPPQINDICSQNASTKSIQSLEERTPKSEARDHKTLKVRIKVGSENFSVKKNADIYSSLGLDGSPASSLHGSPMESEGLSFRQSFQSLESPTRIIQIMVSAPLFEGCFLSPLRNDLICLSERQGHLKDFLTELSSKENPGISFIGHPSLSVKEQETFSGVKSNRLVDKKKTFLQDKKDGKENIDSPLPLKNPAIDDVSCEELVSNALKLPLLSNAHDKIKDSPRALHNRAANVGADKSKKQHSTPDIATSLKTKKISKIGQKDPMNQGNMKSSSHDDGIDLPCGMEHTLPGDEKRPKKSKVHDISTKLLVPETNDDSPKLQKDGKHADNENKARRKEVQKDPTKVRDQYIDVFGEMNEAEVDIVDSLDAPVGKKLKSSENGPSLCEPLPILVDGIDNWVQCDKCQKWRMFPPGSRVDNLPAEWDCSFMTWLPWNHCSVSEDESNNFHAPPLDLTAANILSTGAPSNGKITSKGTKKSKSFFQGSPNRRSNSIMDKPQLVKEAKEPCLVNVIDIQQPSKTSDIYQEESGQHKKIDKQRTDCYSDGGDDNVTSRKGRRDYDQEFPRAFKKSKMQNTTSSNNDPAAFNDNNVDILGVSSCYGYGDAPAGKDRISKSENSALKNSKDDISGSINKKRKGGNFKDSPSSTPFVKLADDDERSSRKRHRISKSEGKESSSSKRSGKADKKGKNVSHHKSGTNESLQRDSSCANPIVAATLSTSKVSESFKVKCKFQEVKDSPVESVSSSPLRILKSDKLPSESKVIVKNDNGQDALGKDPCISGSFRGSPINSMIDIGDKSKGTIQFPTGNGCNGNVKLGNGYPSEAHTSHRCVNETTRGEVELNANVSHSGKSWKHSPSLSKEKNQNLKSNSSVKGKVKASRSCENSLDYLPVSKEREREKKVKVNKKSGSNTDKTENCALLHNKELSFSKSEVKQEHDNKKFSRKFEVNKSEDMKSRQLPHSDGDKNETSHILQPCLGSKASTSACDKKSDSHNGTQFPSKHPISNGHRIKTQDAPSPLRRDSSSSAASSAIKEAKDLKHLADRLKSSGSIDSTGMYFEAALKFLHGASLLESGKTDIAQSIEMYSSTAKLCQFCAHEFEKSSDMATAALAYKCVEVAYLRVIYASRDRHELQHALQMLPPGESPSSSASDIDNTANGDKVTQARNSGSPQLAVNLVIAAKNRSNFSRILNFTQDVNYAMEASRKSRIAYAAANGKMCKSDSKDGITSIKRALDFNFHDVDELLRLVRLAKESISR